MPAVQASQVLRLAWWGRDPFLELLDAHRPVALREEQGGLANLPFEVALDARLSRRRERDGRPRHVLRVGADARSVALRRCGKASVGEQARKGSRGATARTKKRKGMGARSRQIIARRNSAQRGVRLWNMNCREGARQLSQRRDDHRRECLYSATNRSKKRETEGRAHVE
jgi:hypothetical protein